MTGPNPKLKCAPSLRTSRSLRALPDIEQCQWPEPTRRPAARRATATRKAFADGSTLGVELVAGVAVGGFIGWALDRWLGSAPFLMVVFLVLGAAAGMMNVFRAATAMQAKAPPAGKDLPADVTDDDD